MKAAPITIDGKAIGFVARKAPSAESCKGCLFVDDYSTVCDAAWRACAESGQPMCEHRAPNGGTFIYVEADPCQLVLDEEVLP